MHIHANANAAINRAQVCVQGRDVELPLLESDGDGGRRVRWCGLEIDTNHLCVSMDVKRFTGYHIRDSLTMPAVASRRAHARHACVSTVIVNKVMAAAKSKLHPILLDSDLNPPWRVRQNLYQVLRPYESECVSE